jgi:hypothetical protein
MHGLYVAMFICGTVSLTMLGVTLSSLAEERTKQLQLLVAARRPD